MVKWEYISVPGGSNQEVLDNANKLGKYGWEAVNFQTVAIPRMSDGCHFWYYCHMKRRIG